MSAIHSTPRSLGTGLVVVFLILFWRDVFAQPGTPKDIDQLNQLLERALKHCENAPNLAACLEDFLNEEVESNYEPLPDPPAGTIRVTLESQTIDGLIAARMDNSRIQISHAGSGESIFVGPFEVLDIPSTKMEYHLARAQEECLPVCGTGDIDACKSCFDNYFDRYKTTRWAERFSFIRWGPGLTADDDILDDPRVEKAGFVFQVNNLHSVVPNSGFSSGISPWQATEDSPYTPALFLQFWFDSPSSTIVCSSRNILLDCPDASLYDVSIKVTCPLIVNDQGQITYNRDRIAVKFNSSDVDIHWDAGILEEIVGRFTDLKQVIADEVEEKVKDVFEKEEMQNLVSESLMNALCLYYSIDEVSGIYITPALSLVIDGVQNPNCLAMQAMPASYQNPVPNN